MKEFISKIGNTQGKVRDSIRAIEELTGVKYTEEEKLKLQSFNQKIYGCNSNITLNSFGGFDQYRTLVM